MVKRAKHGYPPLELCGISAVVCLRVWGNMDNGNNKKDGGGIDVQQKEETKYVMYTHRHTHEDGGWMVTLTTTTRERKLWSQPT